MTAKRPSKREVEQAQRAGPNQWLWDGLTLTVVENTLSLAALEPIVRSVQPEFLEVRIRRHAAGPQSTPLGGDIALWVTLVVGAGAGIAAKAFLEELGKDAYRGFRAAVFAAYRRVTTWANLRGYRRLAIEIDRGKGLNVLYRFPDEMGADEFERAIEALLVSNSRIRRRKQQDWPYIFMEFDSNSGSWTEVDD